MPWQAACANVARGTGDPTLVRSTGFSLSLPQEAGGTGTAVHLGSPVSGPHAGGPVPRLEVAVWGATWREQEQQLGKQRLPQGGLEQAEWPCEQEKSVQRILESGESWKNQVPPFTTWQ